MVPPLQDTEVTAESCRQEQGDLVHVRAGYGDFLQIKNKINSGIRGGCRFEVRVKIVLHIIM